jgi:hypothetical protein
VVGVVLSAAPTIKEYCEEKTTFKITKTFKLQFCGSRMILISDPNSTFQLVSDPDPVSDPTILLRNCQILSVFQCSFTSLCIRSGAARIRFPDADPVLKHRRFKSIHISEHVQIRDFLVS